MSYTSILESPTEVARRQHIWQIPPAEIQGKFDRGEIMEGATVGTCRVPSCGELRIYVAGSNAQNAEKAYIKCLAEYVFL